MGYINTPWDLKLFYKWINDKPIFVIAHSDDSRWFGSEDVAHEWDALIKNFNKLKYTVTDCTDKEFVGINRTHDDRFNYYMDQTRMITEANLKRAKEEKLPYPMGNLPLSKKDGAPEVSRKRYYLDCVCKSRGRLSQDSSLAVDLLSCLSLES